MSTLKSADLTVLVLYIIAIVLFGCWFARRSQSTKEFMTAGGRLSSWAVGLSIFGTYLSSNTFIGVPGKSFGGNWNFFTFSLTLPIAAWIASRYFVPFYRNLQETSAYEHLEKRFGFWARMYGVICYLLTQIARMGTIMFGVALALRALTNFDIEMIIIFTGILVTFYTLVGGIEAVIWTDVIQSIILTLGAFLVVFMILMEIPGGFGEAVSIAKQSDKFSLGTFQLDFTTSSFWVVFFFGLFINLTNFGIDQSFVQRYHTADSMQAAKKSVWMGALLYVPVSLLFFFIGSILFSYYELNPAQLLDLKSSLTPGTSLSDKVLPFFIANKLPVGLAGLLIAAIFAAAMSSIDTSLNSSATVILEDFFKRFSKRELSEKLSMKILKVSTVIWGSLGTLAALLMIGAESVLSLWWKLQGALAGGILGLFLIGYFSKKANSKGAIVAVVFGVLSIIWINFYQSYLHSQLAIVLGTLIIAFLGYVFSFSKSR